MQGKDGSRIQTYYSYRWVPYYLRSDAFTHIERLVFVGEKFTSGYGSIGIHIDGSHTIRIHGGDERYVYPDEVYLRHLGIINGVKINIEK